MSFVTTPRIPFSLMPSYGISINECVYLTERIQVRFPRSKRKRIRNKWAKQSKNFRTVPSNKCLFVDGVLNVHPAKMRQLADELTGKVKAQLEVFILNIEEYRTKIFEPDAATYKIEGSIPRSLVPDVFAQHPPFTPYWL